MRVSVGTVELLLSTGAPVVGGRQGLITPHKLGHRFCHQASASPTPFSPTFRPRLRGTCEEYERQHGCCRLSTAQLASPTAPAVATNIYQPAVDALLDALRQDDVLRLCFCLLELTRDSSRDYNAFCHAVQSIPATTFSQLLRALDPFHVATQVDSAPHMRISYSVAAYTPLGELVNKWGIKVLYVKILHRLRLLVQARCVASGRFRPRMPLLNDFVILLRYAGATADIQAVKDAWLHMKEAGYKRRRHADLFAEFIKARYLTEGLYASHDLSRYRLRPLDLHRAFLRFSTQVHSKLLAIYASTTEKRLHRFGLNPNLLYFAEPLTRKLRGVASFTKLLSYATRNQMIAGNESVFCALLKASGRVGHVAESVRLLRHWANVNIVSDEQSAGIFSVEFSSDTPAQSAQPPTAALLDAIVHCFGNQGEIHLTVQLVDVLSRRYSLTVPDSVWSDLLDFARIAQVKGASQEWKISRLREHQTVRADTVMSIWTLCTQAPYNFKPGMKDYFTINKALVAEHASLLAPLDVLRTLKTSREEVFQELCDAYCELVVTTKYGLPNHGAYRRYRVAQSKKHFIYHCFNYTTYQMLQTVKPGLVHDNNAVRHVPNLIGEFGHFMRREIKYRIATGIVELSNDAAADIRTTFTERTVEVPADAVRDAHEARAKADSRRRRVQERQADDLDELEGGEFEPGSHGDGVAQEMFEESLSRPDTAPGADDVGVQPRRAGYASFGDEQLREVNVEASHSSVVPPKSSQWHVERPAYLLRPPWTAPDSQLSMAELKQSGREFKGYPDKGQFAVQQLRLSVHHATATPVNLSKYVSFAQIAEHMLLMKTK